MSFTIRVRKIPAICRLLFFLLAAGFFQPVGAVTWYLNDTSTTGDSYTTATGLDANLGLSRSTPKRTFASLLALLNPGDTVLMDAGAFDSPDTIVISWNDLTIAGVDSALTVIRFSDASSAGARTLVVRNIARAVVRDLAITGGWIGLWLQNADSATMTRVRAEGMGSNGFRSDSGSENANFQMCLARGNAGSGFLAVRSVSGIYVGNRSESNTGEGFAFSDSSNTAQIRDNVSSGNGGHGFSFLSCSSLVVTLSIAENNGGWGFHVESGSQSNTFSKNTIRGGATNPDSLLSVGVAGVSFTRAWWGSADSVVIRSRIGGPQRLSAIYTPFRLGEIDTRSAADTIAPKAPDSFSASPVLSFIIRLNWRIVSGSEEPEAAAQLAGFRIYRAETTTASAWTLLATTAPSTTSYDDGSLPFGRFYAYRITALDSAGVVNESFFADSLVFAVSSIDTLAANTWYVNDSSLAGDSFTSAVGADTQNGLLPNFPRRSLKTLTSLLTLGDTILLDAGSYYESDSVLIDTNSVSLIGRDSATSIIAYTNSSASGLRMVASSNRSGMVIRDLAIVGGYRGISWDNVDSGRIERVRADSAGQCGILLANGSNGNILNLVTGSGSGETQIAITGSTDDTLTACRAGSGGTWGIAASGVSRILIDSCLATGGTNGFLFRRADSSILRNCRASRHTGSAFVLEAVSANNRIESNVSAGGSTNGFYLLNSDSNIILSNTAVDDTYSFFLNTSHGNNLTANTAQRNSYGILLLFSDRTLLQGNTSINNLGDGVILIGSKSSLAHQNTIDSNGAWAISIDAGSSADTFTRNILSGSPTRPDSVVYIVPVETFRFTRNWWGTTDSVIIRRRVYGPGRDLAATSPFLLREPDSSPGADTVAARAPDTVAAQSVQGALAIRVTWKASSGSEETENAVRAIRYSIYRSSIADTTVMTRVGTVDSPALELVDSGLTLGATWFYRVTTLDAALRPNESFFSDSTASATVSLDTRGANEWYLNDTSSAGDLFTTALGYDTNTGYSIQAPRRTLGALLPFLTAGDTVFLDAGEYYLSDTVTLDTFALALVGRDSRATRLIFGESSPVATRSLVLRGARGTVLRDLSIESGLNGIRLENSDSAVVIRVRVTGHSGAGILVDSGTEDLILRQVAAEADTGPGLRIAGGSARIAVLGMVSIGNGGAGIQLDSATNISVNQAWLSDNGGWALVIESGATGCTVARSNLLGSASRPDSGVWIASTARTSLIRNWWGSRDSNIIRGRIQGPGRDSTTSEPFRFTAVDSAIGADTIAPTTPVITASDTVYGGIRVVWSIPATNEDSHAGSPGIAAFRVYRSRETAPADWGNPIVVKASTDTSHTDTSVVADTFYMYVVTASDAAPRPNESFYSNVRSGRTTRKIGDLSGDAAIGNEDVKLLLNARAAQGAFDLLYDLNGDNRFDLEDFFDLGRRYGQ